MKTNPWRGVVEVQVVGAREVLDGAAELFAARYGDAVAVRRLGPDRFLGVLRPLAWWTSDGPRIRVFFALDFTSTRRRRWPSVPATHHDAVHGRELFLHLRPLTSIGPLSLSRGGRREMRSRG